MSTKLKKRPLRDLQDDHSDNMSFSVFGKRLMTEDGTLSKKPFILNHLSTLFPDLEENVEIAWHQALKKVFEESGKDLKEAVTTLERMRADISRRLALDTPNSKALSSGGNDCPLSPLNDCKLGAESKPQGKGAGQLSEDKIQKLRTFSLQQITLTVNQLSSCKDHSEASKLLETFLGNILSTLPLI